MGKYANGLTDIVILCLIMIFTLYMCTIGVGGVIGIYIIKKKVVILFVKVLQNYHA